MDIPTKILNHVAIPVGFKEDITNFYCNVLGFTEQYRFVVDQKTAFSIFGFEHELEVTLIEKDGLKLELFHTVGFFKPGISHICLTVSNKNEICLNAERSGYQLIMITRPAGSIAFISDKTGNRFEIKEVSSGDYPVVY
ncbi:MAG: VOC family protein [Bacteroidales bacterium]|nr:VOC family protein [Bacteroidales bacterium]